MSRDPQLVARDLMVILLQQGHEDTVAEVDRALDNWTFWPPERINTIHPWNVLSYILQDDEEKYGRSEGLYQLFVMCNYTHPTLKGIELVSNPASVSASASAESGSESAASESKSASSESGSESGSAN